METLQISPWVIYWFTRLEPLHGLARTLLIISSFLLLFYFVFVWTEGKGRVLVTATRVSKKYVAPAFALSLLFLCFVPDEKDMALIYVVPRLAESRVIQRDLPDLYETAVDRLRKIARGGETAGTEENP